MELQFHKKPCEYLRTVKRQVQTMEQTQEVRINDGMPDIGRVLGAWGQVLVRGKQWQSDGFGMSGGVMTWVLYEPEGGGIPCAVETWIPFQMNWEFQDPGREGKICLNCLLRSIDARSTSARKLMVRANVSILGHATVSAQSDSFLPAQMPEDIQVLKRAYPVLLPVEAGEKEISLDDKLQLPGSSPKMEKLIRYQLQPEIIDKKVMTDKVVFRGVGILHVVYLAEDGSVCSWDFDVPFSQYAQLEGSYDPEATVQVQMVLTNLELEPEEEGLFLRGGMVGQYTVFHETLLETIEDAYSPHREVTGIEEELQIPMVLDRRAQTVTAEQTMPVQVQRVVDVAVYSDHPKVTEEADTAAVHLSGQFQVLYYDQDGQLQGNSCRYEQEQTMTSDQNCRIQATVCQSGKPQTMAGGSEISLRTDAVLETSAVSDEGITVLTGLDVGDQLMQDPLRPSLILRRKDEKSLWQLAKESGSTVESILSANKLQQEPEDNQMLLIPVL